MQYDRGTVVVLSQYDCLNYIKTILQSYNDSITMYNYIKYTIKCNKKRYNKKKGKMSRKFLVDPSYKTYI